MNIAPDKKQHALAGSAIAALAALGATWAGLDSTTATITAFGAAALAGAAKEGIDAMGYGTPDVMDFVYTAAGALPVAAMWLVLGGIVQ